MCKVYFKEHFSESGVFIAIKHGESFYSTTTVHSQGHADELNRRQEITPAEVEAAEMCSIFGCWDNFDSIVEMEVAA